MPDPDALHWYTEFDWYTAKHRHSYGSTWARFVRALAIEADCERLGWSAYQLSQALAIEPITSIHLLEGDPYEYAHHADNLFALVEPFKQETL